VEVEPDIVECTRTGLSNSSPKRKSLLKPEIVSQEEASINPVTTTTKKESPLKHVLQSEERDLQE